MPVLRLLLLALSTTSCYPIYKTLAPAASVTVRDAQQRPVAGARVTLITNFYPHGRESARDTLMTDSVGVAAFLKRAAWETEFLMIHGAKLYFWNWCVERPGFATFDTRRIGGGKFDATTTVTLVAGSSTPCPSRTF